MATILLDTSVIFDHLNGLFGRSEQLDDLLQQGHMLACCPVNFTEVYSGLRPGEETKTKEFLLSLEFYAVTQEIATQAGLLRRDWRQKGQTLSYTDVTIASSRSRQRPALLTDNQKHFPMPEPVPPSKSLGDLI